MSEEELARPEVFKSQICIDRCAENGNCNDCYVDYEDVKAVEHLLKGYKDLQQRIDKAINHINSIYGWRIAHIDTSTIDIPLLTLCEELLSILQGKE